MKWKIYLGKMHYYFTKKIKATVCTAKRHLWDENTLLLLVLRCLLITLNEYSENILCHFVFSTQYVQKGEPNSQ